MALSYSGIVGRGKFTLPSVESWSTNNNILKDPPRSIVAPRRDKVGANSMITQEVEMSRDRIAEAILAYPRGVNPMVGVSYNGGGNAGIHSGQALLNPGRQAKLSYRVMMDGAFRPPILAPVDLLPLSRMPRLVTKVNCAINNPDFRKKLSCEAQKNTYRVAILNTSCAATATQNICRPSEVIDPRHANTRKNAVARDVVINCASKGNEREIKGLINTATKPHLNIQALHLNPFQRREGGAVAGTVKVDKCIGKSLVGDIPAPFCAPKWSKAAPAEITGCRDSVFRAEIHPLQPIKRACNMERPEFNSRPMRAGSVLAPDGGVYNVARR